ncbi:hypothetical protein CsatB_023482 [Cannabis sativa]|uniref:uncharacterized protein LOC115713351 n=1 Tax=Cannabis sativa TaxID=3483 RepID=UPI0029CA7222|nr:uncharacterized protein LOC115713351 [Cannabis sativa]
MLKIESKPNFKFYDRCAELNLNHLMFIDDVILFCHGDFKSIYYVLQGLKLFSRSSSLQPNPNKSAIYCYGMDDQDIQRIIDCSRFSKKEVPLKYFGIPICAKRISVKESMVLADKMTARIKTWSSRNLSLAGRAILVNSILMSIHFYWSQVMVLLKKTIRDIEAICRAYLWKGHHVSQGSGPIAWDHVCQPKATGGISLKKIAKWNIAAMTKYVWVIANKEDNLWIRWIHCVYIKGEEWWNYQAPPQASWYWRKLVVVKNQVKASMDIHQFVFVQYKISNGYKALCPPQNKMNWSHEVWNRLNIPRHSFFLWIVVQDRLRTRERLYKLNIIGEDFCLFCKDQTESSEHLFFSFSFSKLCLSQVKAWLGWRVETTALNRLLRWLERAKISRFHKVVLVAAVVALVYHLWKNRNDILWNSTKQAQEQVVHVTKEDVKSRVVCNWPKYVKPVDGCWFSTL